MRADDIESRERASSSADKSSADEAARQVWKNLTELLEYGVHFLSARADQLKLKIRTVLLWVVAGVLGAVALVTVIVVAVSHLLSGLAEALGVAIGAQWAGSLIVGGAVLGLLALGGSWVARSMMSRARNRTVAKYEQRKNLQRERFGQTVAQRARDEAPAPRI